MLISFSTAFAGGKTTRKISSESAEPQTLFSDIEQDKSRIDRAIEALNKDSVMQARLSDGMVVLGVYDTGARFRCDCGNYLVKVKDRAETRIDAVSITQGKVKWLK